MSARRIVDAALAFEAEGMTTEEAFAAAVAKIRVSPFAVAMARRCLDALARRAGRVEIVLPDRDRLGRFVGTH